MNENDRYETLRQTSPDQLLEAAINFYSQSCPDIDIDKWMRLGFKLATEYGWEEVAPAWLKDLAKLSTKYFHELTKEEFIALMKQDMTWGELSEKHPQPKWCDYYNALDGSLGCWSLINQLVTGKDFCKNRKCDCYKGEMKQGVLGIAEDINAKKPKFCERL